MSWLSDTAGPGRCSMVNSSFLIRSIETLRDELVLFRAQGKCLKINCIAELPGKAHSPQHAQGVVIKAAAAAHAHDFILNILPASQRIDKRSVAGFAQLSQIKGQGIDGKVAQTKVAVDIRRLEPGKVNGFVCA